MIVKNAAWSQMLSGGHPLWCSWNWTSRCFVAVSTFQPSFKNKNLFDISQQHSSMKAGSKRYQIFTNIYRWWCKTLLSTAAVARIWPYNCTICSQRSHNAIKPGGSIHFHFLFHPIFHIFSPFSPYCFISGYLRVKVVRDFFEQLQSPRQSQCALPRDCWLHRGGTVSMSMAALAVLNGIVSCIPTLRWSP